MGKSIRRPVSPKRQLKKNICFLVEGTTEENVIDHLYNKTDFPRISFHKEQYGGGGYVDIKHWIAKRRDRLDIVIAGERVASLSDEEKKTEKKSLIEVIHFLYRENPKNNIFLTFPDFEQWMLKGLQNPKQSLYQSLGYATKSAQKSDKSLAMKYERKGGSFAFAAEYFTGKPLFYKKKDFTSGIIREEYIDKEQSALWYLKDYLKVLNDR